MAIPRPRSLMGQMLLAVAAALLLVQGVSSYLVYRAQREAFVAMAGELWQLTAELRRLLGSGVAREATANDPPAPAG